MKGANGYGSLCPNRGALLCSTTGTNAPLLERSPWKLQRTLLNSGCKHCKNFGKGLFSHCYGLPVPSHDKALATELISAVE